MQVLMKELNVTLKQEVTRNISKEAGSDDDHDKKKKNIKKSLCNSARN